MYQTDSGRSPSIQDLVYQTFLRCQFYFIHAFIANMYILSFPVCIGKTLFLGTSVQREFFLYTAYFQYSTSSSRSPIEAALKTGFFPAAFCSW